MADCVSIGLQWRDWIWIWIWIWFVRQCREKSEQNRGKRRAAPEVGPCSTLNLVPCFDTHTHTLPLSLEGPIDSVLAASTFGRPKVGALLERFCWFGPSVQYSVQAGKPIISCGFTHILKRRKVLDTFILSAICYARDPPLSEEPEGPFELLHWRPIESYRSASRQKLPLERASELNSTD